jgi:hypothetical protein
LLSVTLLQYKVVSLIDMLYWLQQLLFKISRLNYFLMKKNVLLFFCTTFFCNSFAQTLGGGTMFSNAVFFDNTWLSGCPSAGISFSNVAANEPTVALDPCVAAPSAGCATGTFGSDVWFKFYAQSTTATIIVNPTAAFNLVLQAFSGTACPGLTEIGCTNAGGGNNQPETLVLTGLTVNTIYYFRLFGLGNNAGARTGPYHFCGTTGLSSTLLPVELSSLNATAKSDKVELNWTVESALNNLYFEIERSNDASQYQTIGKVAGAGTTAQTAQYSFIDIAPAAANFYRLKMVDNNGSFKYSAVVTARLAGKIKNAISINPNPVADKINLKVTAAAAVNSSIKILNTVGQVVYQQNKKLVKGENIIIINKTNNLIKGLYFLQVSGVNETLNTRVISIQ